MAAGRARIPDPLAKADFALRELLNEPVLEDIPVGRSGPIRILRLGQVIEATGLGKSEIYELQATGHFPMRVQITSHCVGWVEEDPVPRCPSPPPTMASRAGASKQPCSSGQHIATGLYRQTVWAKKSGRH
jgi:predicted DNA-binding transcriptional regulator AlpA